MYKVDNKNCLEEPIYMTMREVSEIAAKISRKADPGKGQISAEVVFPSRMPAEYTEEVEARRIVRKVEKRVKAI